MAVANSPEDSLAYNQHQPTAALQLTALSGSSSAGITASLPLNDPLPAEIAPAAASIITNSPVGNSFLEAVTAMVGTVGMLILVFRRRVESSS